MEYLHSFQPMPFSGFVTSPELDGEVSKRSPEYIRRLQSALPALIKREDLPAAYTLYVDIALGSESPAKSITGIFIPQNYQPQAHVDLILYLHGHKTGREVKPNTTIDRYWCAQCIRYFPLRERLNESRKNVILVAPTLGPRSGAGWLVQKGGLDKYLDQVLAVLTAYGPYRSVKQSPGIGNIILACHSGGGYPMRALALSTGNYTSRIKECWGFDCTYNRGDDVLWTRWAKSHPAARLFIYYISGSGTARNAEALKRMKVSNVIVAVSSVSHNWVPIKYWRERIQGAQFLVDR